ncbi:RNA ligase [Gemmobacter caeni]|uniref:RNA ligase n=1 Tax=Gemmobacter caeni TaxID=589035 RepID=A0A2T6ATI4_9RHOB|nr:RNA ligase family protein [Gemmobacter caeni]PTX47026.1 RNA ligase [Gemmobacter caeni]TWI96117.1 RNA ligase [Gemmobacter caeni]
MEHIRYPSTHRFADVVTQMIKGSVQSIRVRPKIKLHGANVGIIQNGDQVYLQSRNHVLVEFDMFSVLSELRLPDRRFDRSYAIYGEWAGPGCAEEADAVSDIPKRTFFPFALAIALTEDKKFDHNSVGHSKRSFTTDPDAISAFLSEIYTQIPENICVLPWAGPEVEIRAYDHEHNRELHEDILAQVDAIGVEDPYVKDHFGVCGRGEGLVFTQVPGDYLDGRMPMFFKVKAAHHDPVRRTHVKHETVLSKDVAEFVHAFVTENRVRQMAAENTGGVINVSQLGKLIPSVIRDVLNEGANEIEAGNLDTKQVGKIAPSVIRSIVIDIQSREAA